LLQQLINVFVMMVQGEPNIGLDRLRREEPYPTAKSPEPNDDLLADVAQLHNRVPHNRFFREKVLDALHVVL
jgi:hypothetical protein